MKTLSFLVAYFLLVAFSSSAQTTFQKAYGGLGNDNGYSAQQTADGGYVIAGSTISFGTNTVDVYLIKTDANGDSLWTKTFGGANYEEGRSVQQTTDGGYIITGSTSSFGAGSADVYLIKTGINGNLVWTKTFGGINAEWAYSVRQTMDGGYVIAGITSSFGAGLFDVYLIKTDANGDSLWTKTFGGTSSEGGNCVQPTTDGGYIIVGQTYSFGPTSGDIYLIKTDPNGDSLWTKTIHAPLTGINGLFIQQTTDGGYIIAGSAFSVSTNNSDVYLIKTNDSGNLMWTKAFGATGSGNDGGYSVQQTADGGYIVAGYFNSFGISNADAYLIKTDTNGDSLWVKTFRGMFTSNNYGYAVQQTTDGGYFIAGHTSSFGMGGEDIYLIKTDSNGYSGCNEGNPVTIMSIPVTQTTNPATIVTSPPTVISSTSTTIGSGGTLTTQCITTGIQPEINNSQFGISISPNPSPGDFTITFPGAINRGEVQIFNAYGSKVFSQNIHHTSNTEIHLKHIPGGIYFVKVWNGEKYFSNKIIIQQN